MALEIHPDSHLDHGLLPEHVAFLRERFSDRGGFIRETVELPPHLPSLPCGLYGPAMGDEPVPEREVTYRPRGGREHLSRVVSRPMRETRLLTIIAGPYRDAPLVLYTAHGGPIAPRELESMRFAERDEVDASIAFWKVHALAG